MAFSLGGLWDSATAAAGDWASDPDNWWDAGTSLAGAYSGYQQAQTAADQSAQTLAGQQALADKAVQQAMPWNITSSSGAASFDPTTRTGMLGLTPEMEAYRNIFMTRAPSHASAIAPYEGDPFAAAQALYEQESDIYAPQREEEQLGLEKRLLAQGMLGSTGGAKRLEAQQTGFAQADAQRQADALQRVQGLVDVYRGREVGDLEVASQIASLPLVLGNLGQGIGSGLTGTISTGLGETSAALQSLGSTQAAASPSAFWKGIFG